MQYIGGRSAGRTLPATAIAPYPKEKNMAGNRMTKSEFLVAIAEKSSLSKKQAGTVLDAISSVIAEQLKSSGEVTLPGLIKLSVSTKEATPEREGINPFTK